MFNKTTLWTLAAGPGTDFPASKDGAIAASCPKTLVGIADSSLKRSTVLLLEYWVIGGLGLGQPESGL
eukprot:3243244-Rhodomonas_salina.2